MEITNEVSKYIDSITKRVYPLTEKEKNCINEFGKMHVNRGHLKKAIIETISKYDSKATQAVLDSSAEQTEADNSTLHG